MIVKKWLNKYFINKQKRKKIPFGKQGKLSFELDTGNSNKIILCIFNIYNRQFNCTKQGV